MTVLVTSVLFFYFKRMHAVCRIIDFARKIVGIFHPLTVFIWSCIFTMIN